MAVSQNGWAANNSSLIASYTIPGTSVKIALRKGDASVVLLHLAAWFHKNIQPLRQSDTGGYNPRTIRGSSTTSNHASGTAEDLRWNDHPLGAHDTFSNEQEVEIRTQLKYYNGVIRWGADYSGRKDEMHFEINKGTAATKAVADKIRNAQKPKPQEDDVELSDHIGNKAYASRTVGTFANDLQGVRDVLRGDETGTKAAAYPATAPLMRLLAVPAQLAALTAAVTALTGKDFTDEQAIVAGVLAGLDPAAIAAAVAAALPADQAKQVVDELTSRLAA